jgi:hypothetical protein
MLISLDMFFPMVIPTDLLPLVVFNQRGHSTYISCSLFTLRVNFIQLEGVLVNEQLKLRWEGILSRHLILCKNVLDYHEFAGCQAAPKFNKGTSLANMYCAFFWSVATHVFLASRRKSRKEHEKE